MKKVLIIQSVFYDKISAMLLDGARAELTRSGCSFEVISVPGVFEIATVISMCKDLKNKIFKSYELYDGYIALGCVIRGETTHYDYVCSESARALQDLGFKHKLAIGNGILTVENEAQAIERADQNKKDKGGFAAYACVEMMKLRETLVLKRVA